MTFYLGTILVSLIGNSLVILKISKDISNRQYKFNRIRKNQFDPTIILIQLFLLSALPVGNLILSGILLFGADKFSRAYIKNAISYGALVKKEKSEIIEEVELDNDLVKDAKVVVYKVEDKDKKEMTREEKIKFLKEEYKRLTNEKKLENTKGKQRSLGKRR